MQVCLPRNCPSLPPITPGPGWHETVFFLLPFLFLSSTFRFRTAAHCTAHCTRRSGARARLGLGGPSLAGRVPCQLVPAANLFLYYAQHSAAVGRVYDVSDLGSSQSPD